MAHTASAPRGAALRSDLLVIIALTGFIGFSIGQNWPVTAAPAPAATETMTEDWHGNVRRSTWPN